jgi:NADH-quinone oxidoreductase subunit M
MATLLVLTVFLPMAGAIALVVLPRQYEDRVRTIALAIAIATCALSLCLLAGFRSQVAGPQFAFVTPEGRFGISWTGTPPEVRDRPDIRFALGLDGLSLWLFVLTALLSITAVCSSWESVKERVAAHYALLLVLETGSWASLPAWTSCCSTSSSSSP